LSSVDDYRAATFNSRHPTELGTLGDHLRKVRLDRNLLQRDVAGQIGVHTDTLSEWEGNRSAFQSRYVPAIIDFLAYSPYEPANSFADWLRMAREGPGLSQAGLARTLGLAHCPAACPGD